MGIDEFYRHKGLCKLSNVKRKASCRIVHLSLISRCPLIPNKLTGGNVLPGMYVCPYDYTAGLKGRFHSRSMHGQYISAGLAVDRARGGQIAD